VLLLVIGTSLQKASTYLYISYPNSWRSLKRGVRILDGDEFDEVRGAFFEEIILAADGRGDWFEERTVGGSLYHGCSEYATGARRLGLGARITVVASASLELEEMILGAGVPGAVFEEMIWGGSDSDPARDPGP